MQKRVSDGRSKSKKQMKTTYSYFFLLICFRHHIYISFGIIVRGFFLSHPTPTPCGVVARKTPVSALAKHISLASYSMKRGVDTDLHVFLMLPGKGAPHAIFLPRQKRQARGGFLSGVFLEGKELRPTDGDGAEFNRNSVGGGVDGEGVAGDVSYGLGCDPLPSWGESRWLRSDN